MTVEPIDLGLSSWSSESTSSEGAILFDFGFIFSSQFDVAENLPRVPLNTDVFLLPLLS